MEKVSLFDQSFEKIEISGSKELEITVNKNASCSLYLLLKDKSDVKCHIYVQENAHLKLLSWNESDELSFENEIYCAKDSKMELNLGELSDGNTNESHKIHLQEEGSTFALRSASTVSSTKHFDIECIHEASHTESNMENYAVVYKDGDYKMNDTGKIEKGAYGSSSHQTSRALILDKDQKCDITPILLIDENDVQASHATTMGQIDENQLYYLQTRGLTKTQALGLITIGYILPIASALDDETIQEELSAKVEKKVGLA